MAGQGKKTFSDGEVLSAADVNGYLMDQSVMRFADSSARTAAIGTPTEGMVTYLDDVNQIEVYDGTAWVDQQAPILSEGTAGQYLQSNGTAGAEWVDLEIADDIITTQGDLIVGDAGGTAVRLAVGAENSVLTSNGTAATWALPEGGGGGFNTIDKITASDAAYPIPTLASNVVRFTLIAGGGGGVWNSNSTSGGTGGDTTLVVGGVTHTVQGGRPAKSGSNTSSFLEGRNPKVSGNYGSLTYVNDDYRLSTPEGGEFDTFYVDLDGETTLDITIGAGGAGGGTASVAGFRGQIDMEYQA